MDTKPQQDLSLLPGEYYHPEAELGIEKTWRGVVAGRGHRVNRRKHGLWEWTVGGKLSTREYFFQGSQHGPCYNYIDGTFVKSEFWYRGDVNMFIFPSLFHAATGLPHFPFIE
jgi:hypothetical protein